MRFCASADVGGVAVHPSPALSRAAGEPHARRPHPAQLSCPVCSCAAVAGTGAGVGGGTGAGTCAWVRIRIRVRVLVLGLAEHWQSIGIASSQALDTLRHLHRLHCRAPRDQWEITPFSRTPARSRTRANNLRHGHRKKSSASVHRAGRLPPPPRTMDRYSRLPMK